MSEYRIFETEQFQKDLRALAKAGQRKIETRLRESVYPELRRHPQVGPNVKKLKDYQPETWRYRIGVWRFFYEIDEREKAVFMIGASHRGSAY